MTGLQALTNLNTYFQQFGLDKDLGGEKKRCRKGGIAVMCRHAVVVMKVSRMQSFGVSERASLLGEDGSRECDGKPG